MGLAWLVKGEAQKIKRATFSMKVLGALPGTIPRG